MKELAVEVSIPLQGIGFEITPNPMIRIARGPRFPRIRPPAAREPPISAGADIQLPFGERYV